jgi:hypothetical protein
MEETEPSDPVGDVRIDQSDPALYLPGTPTVSFTEYVESFIDTLRR